MNLQENIQRIKQVMRINESFEKNIKETDDTYTIQYNDEDIIVGKIRGGVWKNYLTVEHIVR